MSVRAPGEHVSSLAPAEPVVPLSAEALMQGRAPHTAALADSCRYALAQTGKQLRVRLVYEASRLGPDAGDAVRTAARAVELLHVATLAHDDVIDDSPLRRGHASLDREHGGFVAGYAGAWLFGTSMELAVECGEQAAQLFASTACSLCDGEMLETQDLFNRDRTQQSYLAAIAGKTASLFSLAARLGGLAAEAPLATCEALGRYGHDLGMAFQLADDLLDFSPDCAIGKQPGGDLRNGVFTLPVIYAIEADPTLAKLLTDDLGETQLAALIEELRASEAFVRATELCEEYVESARGVARHLGARALEAFPDEALAPLRRSQAA